VLDGVVQEGAAQGGADGVQEGAARGVEAFLAELAGWAWPAAWLALAVAAGFGAHALLFRGLDHLARRTQWKWDESIFRNLRRPSRLLFPLLFAQFVIPGLPGLDGSPVLDHALSLLTIAAVVWLVLGLVDVLCDEIRRRHRLDVDDNLAARALHTQITILSRAVDVFVVVIGLAAALMTFEEIREFGASLLASAGIAGLAIGLAARPVLENLISGVQLALTQPIRVDDVVIVENEWGRIEEITGTYVVVRIWDQRRLIVPFSRFLQQPFQNWTRSTSEILGTVFLHVDPTAPFEAMRAELQRIAEGAPQWDRRVCNLQVTDATERTVQVRCLVSSANSSLNWDLRVHVREKMIEFLQREHPGALPRTRVDVPSEVRLSRALASNAHGAEADDRP
jgi:small-conductance mechanosensitive channel